MLNNEFLPGETLHAGTPGLTAVRFPLLFSFWITTKK